MEADQSDNYETIGNLAVKPKSHVIQFPAPAAAPRPEFDNKLWKLSAKRPGLLIRRIRGYQISEDEYGVSYLFVVSNRKGRKKTKSDPARYEHSGFFTWSALEAAGRTKKVGE